MPPRFSLAAAIVFAAMPVVPSRAAAADAEFPYLAYVAESDALIRSGPGRQHYATAQAPAGFAVEVYRHDAGGWCAIRPPEGSFSLVPLRALQPLDARTAQVTVDGAASRVGSALGDQRNAVQVMLHRGEMVALAGPLSPTDPWVRIAPPAGEFRWIAAGRLSRHPPTETVPAAATPSTAVTPAGVGWQSPGLPASEPIAAAAPRPIVAPEPVDDALAPGIDPFAHLRQPPTASAATPTASPSARPAGAAWASEALASDPRTAAPAATLAAAAGADDDIQLVPGSPAALQQAQFAPAAAASGAAPLVGDPAAAATPGGPPRVRFAGLTRHRGPLDPRVAEMQLHLSQIVLGAPASWQFHALRDEANSLLAQEQSPPCREQLRELLDRIAAFENVRERYSALPPSAQVLAVTGAQGATPAFGDAAAPLGAPAGDSASSALLARIRSDLGRDAHGSPAVDNGITPTPGGSSAEVAALYDAVGTLKPVVSKRPHAPRYALVDDQGEVVTFLTPAADVNLQDYVGQRIGVRGSRGFMPEFRRAHVVANRVTNLEGTVVK
jgi:hypothetical protein